MGSIIIFKKSASKQIDDLNISYLRKIVYKMYDDGEIEREGEKKNMVYFLPNKK